MANLTALNESEREPALAELWKPRMREVSYCPPQFSGNKIHVLYM